MQLDVRDGGAEASEVLNDSVPDPDDPGEGPSVGKSRDPVASPIIVEDDGLPFRVEDEEGIDLAGIDDDVFKAPSVATGNKSNVPRSTSETSITSARSLDRLLKASTGWLLKLSTH